MSAKFFRLQNKRGFTLVELLIVVAIIGVLATIGVPTFRRMIQKSKKSEAKVNLGGVYTSEAAFNAEYNYFGNNLQRLGFEVEGAASTLIYTVGFFQTDCSNWGTVEPSANTPRAAIMAAYPAYYPNANANTRMGQTAFSTCGQASNLNVNASGVSFIAGAAGQIAPASVTRSNATVDVWTINEGRVLANIQDGTN